MGVAVLACVVALAVPACGADGPDSPTADDEAPAPTDPAGDALDRDAARAAAVDVRADGCGPRVGFGTGSVFGEGLIATAAHVVAGAETVEVIAVDGTRVGGEVVLFDPDLDLAVILATAPVGVPLALRPDDAAAGETGIVVLPRLTDEGVAVEVSDVFVLREANIRTTDIYLDQPVERAGFEIEGSIDPGDSGAMVVLPGGGAGVVWARSNVNERRAWAIDLPAALLDGGAARLSAPVDVGPCIR